MKLDLGAAHRGSPEIDQAMLDSSNPPTNVASFFRAARAAFDAQPLAAFADLPAIGAAAEERGLPLLGGPMLGALAPDGARVWVRTTRPAGVVVVVEVAGKPRRFGPVASTRESDLTAVVPVTGLPPGRRHPYRIEVDGKPVPLPFATAIATLPAADYRGRFQIAFGADFHKTGLWNQPLLDRIRARGNAAMLLLGDLAVDDRDNQVGLHRSDYLLRDLSPGWRALAGNAAVYAAWDDHDYFNNDQSGIPPRFTAADRTAVRRVWTECWNNPSYGFPGRDEGIFFRTRLGPCDLIMLDTRSLRTERGAPDAFLGAGQMRWLERELDACTGPFLILTSGTMWGNHISNGKDSWGVWDPAGRERLFARLDAKELPVILLSGDRHGARVITHRRPSGAVFREFELGSLGAHPGPAAFGTPKEDQPFGVTATSLFGEIVFDTAGAEPKATVRIVDAAGTEHYAVTLP